MGLEPLGWQVVFANDVSEKKYEMYKMFFPNAKDHYLVKDVLKISALDIPPTTLATCSFPCVDLSLAGKMNGINGKHSSAFWGFIECLKAQRENAPSLVLVENVPGWLCSNQGADFRLTLRALNQLGYACDVFVLDARRFTPQSRARVFLVGAKLAPATNAINLILQRSKALSTPQLVNSLSANRDLLWFYNEIPDPAPLLTSGLAAILEDIADFDTRWWSNTEVERHLAMMNDTHRERVRQLANKKRLSYRTFFRRRREGQQRVEVRDDELAGCLRTAVGGSGKQFLIKAGRNNIQMRVLTPREYARLQGVPDTYPININGIQALTGFGDAVCVPAISWIAQNILNPLAEKLYSPAKIQTKRAFKLLASAQSLSGN